LCAAGHEAASSKALYKQVYLTFTFTFNERLEKVFENVEMRLYRLAVGS